MAPGPFRPVIVVGAARSGTNMLRDVLTAAPSFGTWDCDEIPFIWRHGHASFPHDEFTPDMATPRVVDYIRGTFLRVARQLGVTNVVEKTCANSLRVGYVDSIFPDAKFVHIVRDGRDALASAMKRWVAPLDLAYVLKKARFVPPRDLPYYGARFLGNRLYKLRSRDKLLASWGPRFRGMEDARRSRSLAEVCAIQWARSVENSDRDFANMSLDRVCETRYEDFVANPEAELSRILEFLGVRLPSEQLATCVRRVSRGSVGKGIASLDEKDVVRVEPILADAMQRHGYLGSGEERC